MLVASQWHRHTGAKGCDLRTRDKYASAQIPAPYKQLQSFGSARQKFKGSLLEELFLKNSLFKNSLSPWRLQVLDVGSGSGYLTIIFAYLVKAAAGQPSGTAVGVDIIPELVRRSALAAKQISFAGEMLAAGKLQFHLVGQFSMSMAACLASCLHLKECQYK